MQPSYPEGRGVWVSAWPYLFRSPARLDVVVIRSPNEPRLELKRILGLPNERVQWTGDAIGVNGAPLPEPFAQRGPAVPGDDDVREVQLGPREYFVAWDNRLHSRDSRRYGPVPRAAILGKAIGPRTMAA